MTFSDALSRVLDAWAEAPSTHPLLGDWRRVGYRRGRSAPRAARPVVRARDQGHQKCVVLLWETPRSVKMQRHPLPPEITGFGV